MNFEEEYITSKGREILGRAGEMEEECAVA
jgi:hypothetical protein